MRGTLEKFYVGIQAMIPDLRQRQPRDVPMQCGNQPANIRVIHRRHELRASRSPSRVDSLQLQTLRNKSRREHRENPPRAS